MARTVMLAIDGSQNADCAFEYYCQFIAHSDDKLVLFHFMDSVSISKDRTESPRELYDIRGSYMEGLKNIFRIKANKYGIDENIVKFEFTCDPPEPGKAVCAASKKHQVNLVIMVSRGISKLKKAFLGSVSDYVLRHSGVPVLAVPYPHK